MSGQTDRMARIAWRPATPARGKFKNRLRKNCQLRVPIGCIACPRQMPPSSKRIDDGFPPSRRKVMRLARVIIKLESRQNLGMILSARNLGVALLRRRNTNCADLTGLC